VKPLGVARERAPAGDAVFLFFRAAGIRSFFSAGRT
jgi:hypothetical protein